MSFPFTVESRTLPGVEREDARSSTIWIGEIGIAEPMLMTTSNAGNITSAPELIAIGDAPRFRGEARCRVAVANGDCIYLI
jgi:hypothetical protein